MIFCFSGTGNTRYVASLIAKLLPNEEVVDITAATSLRWNVTGQLRVIWAMPVHSWGMPEAVCAFMRDVELTGAGDVPQFMVCTCGDDVGLAHEMWRKYVSVRGWRPCSAHSVVMPNTYVCLPGFDVDPHSVAELKMSKVYGRVREVVHAIKCRSKIDDVVKGRMAWLKTKVVYPLFMKMLISPKSFHVTGACVSCGRCVRQCPMENIAMGDDRRPVWGGDCTLCLGCYHVCPCHAVEYGKSTRAKGQWMCRPES